MSLISVQNLTFAYKGSYDNIFEDVSFALDTNWKIGFTGRNGRGKTTFLNLLLGKYNYEGIISKSVSFNLFPRVIEDESVFTIDIINSENHEYWEIARELNLLQVDEDVLYRPFSTLSNGERTKVLLAGMFLDSGKFMLIDEPTNHLDVRSREIVGRYLQKKEGFILVSHDRSFLDSCVDHILAINRTNIEVCAGNFSTWLQNKENQDNFERSQNAKLKKEIAHLTDATKRSTEWANHSEREKIGFNPNQTEKSTGRRAYLGKKSQKMMQRAKSYEHRNQRLIEEKSTLLHNIEAAPDLKIMQEPFHSSRLISFSHASVSYGDRQVCDDVTFTIDRGDRAAIVGANGSGKTTLMKLMMGAEIPYQGEIVRGSQLKISYLPQDTSFLKGNLTDFADERGIDESLFKAILRKLDFARVQFDKQMEDFSAGQRKKVLIAASLCEKSHLCLWDEPLNYIDVFSRIQLENLILGFSPTIVFVEHDKEFVKNVATKIIEL